MSVHLLRKVSLFKDLSPEDILSLSAYFKKETCKPAHTIFWMDENGDHLYIIEKGNVQILYNDENGREHQLALLEPGSFFGELSLIDGGPHTATARAVGEVSLLNLDRDSFYRFLEKHPELARAMLLTLSSRLRSSTVRLRGVINVNDHLQQGKSGFQRFIDGLARALTSSHFLAISVVFILCWIIVQGYRYEKITHSHISFTDKPPTFFLLGFLITLTSFLLTLLILSSQRRQAETDRLRGEVEYQVNVKSQSEVMKLHLKMDRLIEMLEAKTGERITDDPTEEAL